MAEPPGPEADKAAWRVWARQRRAEVDFSVIGAEVRRALDRWGELAGTVLLYAPLPDEIDLLPLIDEHLSCRFVMTRTPEHGGLTVHTASGVLERHQLGYLQPAADAAAVPPTDIDVFLLPGLAFDRRGTRLGRGAGYFDELLTSARPAALRVGTIPEALIVDRLPVAEHDRSMTHLASERGVFIPDYPESTQRFLARAEESGLRVHPVVFAAETRTAGDAAAAVGCDPGAIVKSLVFVVGEAPVVVLISGDQRVDLGKLGLVTAGAVVRRAALEEVRVATGYAAGGTPPLGHTSRLRILADRGLRRYREVWAAAGTPSTVFPADPDRLIEAAGAEWVDVAEGG